MPRRRLTDYEAAALAKQRKLDTLIHKLKDISFLQDDSQSVLYVLKRLSYHYFVFDKMLPDQLWRLISDLVLQWGSLAGGYATMTASEPDFNDKGERLYPKTTWPYATTKAPGEAGVPSLEADAQALLRPFEDLNLAVKDLLAKAYGLGYDAGRDGEMKQQESGATATGSAGDSPAEINFRDRRLQLGIEGVFMDHFVRSHKAGLYICGCKRQYDSRMEWAAHLRKRLVNYITNTFPAIGTEDS